MRIGIDISQLAYPDTGVANYLLNLVKGMIKKDKNNEYILFFSSLRRNIDDQISEIKGSNEKVEVKTFKIPTRILEIIWNRLHIIPIETFIGDVDVFITSDWLEPPSKKAIKATIIYDLTVFKTPDETAANIIRVQKQKLKWVKRESDIVFCISRSTKNDVEEILGIDRDKLKVIYPGL